MESLVSHPKLVEAIVMLVDDDGKVRDNASPELKKARAQLEKAYTKVGWPKRNNEIK